MTSTARLDLMVMSRKKIGVPKKELGCQKTHRPVRRALADALEKVVSSREASGCRLDSLD